MLSGAAGRLLVAYALLGAALTVHAQITLPLSLALALGALWLLLRAGPAAPERPPPGPRAISALLVLLFALSLIHPPGEAPRDLRLLAAYYALTLALLGAALGALRRPVDLHRGRRALALLLLLFLAAGAVRLRLLPEPRIDVFHLQQMGARELLAGRDPYVGQVPNTFYDAAETRAFFGDDRRALTNYPYPPLSLLATAPGWALLGDVRVVYLGLQVMCAALLYALGRGAGPGWALSLAALHLHHPQALFIVEQSWTEPLVAAGALLLLLALALGRGALAAAALGLTLAAKQYSVVLLPLLLPRRIVPRAALGAAVVAAGALCLPFLLWHPRDFIEDVVLFQLRQPFRLDALSLPAALAALTGLRAPGALAILAGLAAAVAAARRAAGVAGLAWGAALAYLCFFLAAKQAFSNYYYMVGVLLLGAAASRFPLRGGAPGGG